MKSSTVPMICGLALAAMSAAGISHWWSVKQFVAAVENGLPVLPPGKPATTTPPAESVPEKDPAPAALAQAPAKSNATAQAADPSQKRFYEALVEKMERLQNQNRDLLDQMAETNRDLMKLEFRVDTHSESFRPLPVSEERIDTSFEEGPGVLPPRAEPVFLPSDE
jgi:hypothetical protein